MFMDITNPFKIVLTISTVPGVINIQNGCQKWLPKAVFGHNFANNYHIIMNLWSKYMFMGMRNSFKMV